MLLSIDVVDRADVMSLCSLLLLLAVSWLLMLLYLLL